MQRTKTQNKSLHKYFQLLAEELNNAGLDMRKTLRNDIDIPWSPELVKEYIWKPIQNAQLQEKSTTELKTNEVSKVYETLNRHLGEKFGLHVPFPSNEPDMY